MTEGTHTTDMLILHIQYPFKCKQFLLCHLCITFACNVKSTPFSTFGKMCCEQMRVLIF